MNDTMTDEQIKAFAVGNRLRRIKRDMEGIAAELAYSRLRLRDMIERQEEVATYLEELLKGTPAE